MNIEYCPKCGTRQPENAKFCPDCGANLTMFRNSSEEDGSIKPGITGVNPYFPRQSFPPIPAGLSQPANRKHSNWMVGYLILDISLWVLTLLMVVFTFGGVVYLGGTGLVDQEVEKFLDYGVFFFFLPIAVIGFDIAIWNWKKWGIYGVAVVYIISTMINLSSGDLAPILVTIVRWGILFFLIRPIWDHFD
jgi:hypothetical protein